DNSLSSMYVENFTPTKEVFNNWGEEWAIDSPGLWFKSYPCCIANTHVIDATKGILSNTSVDHREVQHINIYFPPNGDAALVYKYPENGEEGRFSAEYCIALLLLNKKLDIKDFI